MRLHRARGNAQAKLVGYVAAMLLYRPVGAAELRLMYSLGMRGFPPRLPEQPIFYPVTNRAYAAQIAREWNAASEEQVGFVTRFAVEDAYVARFPRRIVGAREHEELWVPAEDLETFNRHIEGPVEVIEAHFGSGYRATELEALRALPSDAALREAIASSAPIVFLDYYFWEHESARAGGDPLLARIAHCWGEDEPRPRLGLSST